MKKGVSVIVCTFNGALRLPKTIQHLVAQEVHRKFEWEVIFVDNASTDNSTEVVTTEWMKYDPGSTKLTLLREGKPGKIHALEQAFSKARFEYAVICDDDNWLASDYLDLVYQILERDDHIGAVGGQGIPVTDSDPLPDWFQKYQDGYATGEQGIQTGDITPRGHVWGAGLGTRTSLYKKMYDGFPSLLTGRLGEKLTAGEDAEYSQRLILKGYKLFYDSRLVFHHYMPSSRLTLDYRDRLFNGFIESDKILNKYYLANRLKSRVTNNISICLKLLIVSLFRIIFSSSKERRDQARDTLVFLSPKELHSNLIMSKIRRFL